VWWWRSSSGRNDLNSRDWRPGHGDLAWWVSKEFVGLAIILVIRLFIDLFCSGLIEAFCVTRLSDARERGRQSAEA
jgi:hypothetical protein